MEIRLFKHKCIIPKIGIIRYHTLKYNFRKICLNYNYEDAIIRIRELLPKFGLLHLEFKTTDAYFCFILIDAWNKTEVNA